MPKPVQHYIEKNVKLNEYYQNVRGTHRKGHYTILLIFKKKLNLINMKIHLQMNTRYES